MKSIKILAATIAFGFIFTFAQEGPPAPLMLEGDADRGAELAQQICSSCHGENGNSTVSTFPRLSGQNQQFLAIQAWLFKEGIRPSPVMNPIASNLSDQDIADAAAFFAAQEPAGQPWPDQDPALVEQGQTVFSLGNVEGGVIACAICHGADGEGVAATGIPRIAGQGPGYLDSVLAHFAEVPDFHHPIPNAMHIVASALTAEETEAVIAYLASQPWGDQ